MSRVPITPSLKTRREHVLLHIYIYYLIYVKYTIHKIQNNIHYLIYIKYNKYTCGDEKADYASIGQLLSPQGNT